MNVVLAVLLIFFCMRSGHIKTEKLRKRRKVLIAMQQDIQRLAERMVIHPEPFSALLSKFAPLEATFWVLFLDLLPQKCSIAAAFENAMHEAGKRHNGFEYLTADEWRILADYGAGLSAPEIASQQENAAMATKRLGAAAQALYEEIKQKGRVYESLGLLSGLALALLVI